MWRLAAHYLQPEILRGLGRAGSRASVPTPLMVWWAAGFTVLTLLYASTHVPSPGVVASRAQQDERDGQVARRVGTAVSPGSRLDQAGCLAVVNLPQTVLMFEAHAVVEEKFQFTRASIHTGSVSSHTDVSPSKRKVQFNWARSVPPRSAADDEERMVRDTARAYCQDHLAPRVLEMFRQERTDAAIFRELGELDMLGIVIPGGVRRRRTGLRVATGWSRAKSSASIPASAR